MTLPALLERHHDGLSRPLEGARLRVLSLGAGVQSTTLALMAERGLIERPDLAIFADTGWESRAVYQHLDWLTYILPFPVVRVRRHGPDLGELTLSVARGERGQEGAQLVPFYTDGGISPKQCSKEFKTRPVARHIRNILPAPPVRKAAPIVELWLGMSSDELTRIKRNERPWIHNRYPLVEARMKRASCVSWLKSIGVTSPRSSCIFCGYRSNAEWLDVLSDPYDRPRLLAFDRAIRTLMPNGAYLTKHEQPLDEIDFTKPDDGLDLFNNECEGYCGV